MELAAGGPKNDLGAQCLRPQMHESREMLLALEQHPSTLDGEDLPRPYVYEVSQKGLIARWRGTALAWPLIDLVALPAPGVVCALHRALPLERVRFLGVRG